MKPKEALVKDGFLPKGSENKRGRLAAPAIERLKTLAGQGWDIEGYSVSKPVNEGPVEVKKVASDSSRVLDVPDEIRNENEWTATVEGKRIGMREVCRRCSNSFTYCWCEKPLYFVDIDRLGVVVFKPKVVNKDR